MGTLKQFIKENFVLVIGLTLPLMLIVLFFASIVIPKAMSTPPQYEMLFSLPQFNHQDQDLRIIDFVVKDGILKARISNDRQQNPSWAKLMSYDGKTDSVKEITFDTELLEEVVLDTKITDGACFILTLPLENS